MYSKEYSENIEIVRSKLNNRTKLEALAEEASELSKAAAKLIRAKGLSENPTPISEEEAEAKVLEELADVQNCINVTGLLKRHSGKVNMIAEQKMQRWVERLKERETLIP